MNATTTPRERPILFSGAMVRAILAGEKTQTRRVVKVRHLGKIGPAGSDTPEDYGYFAEGRHFSGYMVLARGVSTRGGNNSDEQSIPCPYGEVGDRLWVRETWALDPNEGPDTRSILFRATDPGWDEAASGLFPEYRLKWRPSILMPRWASRISLEVTDVRVERLQAISAADIQAEGVTREAVSELLGGAAGALHDAMMSPHQLWQAGWSAINGAESWDANPWVWVVEFKKMEASR